MCSWALYSQQARVLSALLGKLVHICAIVLFQTVCLDLSVEFQTVFSPAYIKTPPNMSRIEFQIFTILPLKPATPITFLSLVNNHAALLVQQLPAMAQWTHLSHCLLYFVHDCFSATEAEVNSCKTDYKACKAEHISSLTLDIRSLLTLVLGCSSQKLPESSLFYFAFFFLSQW